jgi:hypothetical protein
LKVDDLPLKKNAKINEKQHFSKKVQHSTVQQNVKLKNPWKKQRNEGTSIFKRC